MDEPSIEPARGPLCAEWSRTQRIDPVGTAGSYAGYLLVEWPLPWPRDAGDVQELEPVREVVAGEELRVQLLVPRAGGSRRIVLYRRPAGPFVAFEGSELRVAPEHDEVTGNGAAPDGTAIGKALGRAAERLLAGRGDPIEGRDVLVCTHGRRDRCCGSLGTELWEQLRSSSFEHDTGVRLARTSHTGGHRFAATCIVLPEGTVWGYLDPDALRRIARRAGTLDDLLPRYRGCSGLGSPAAQVLERAVLAEVGWTLFDCTRHVEDLGGRRLRLTASGPAGTAAWEASVVAGRTLRVPDCGQPVELSKKTETEQRVEDLIAR